MTNEEILKKAIEKAERNGYEFPYTKESQFINEKLYGDFIWVPKMIFSHDFAKAFFGEEAACENCGEVKISSKCDHEGIVTVMSAVGPTKRFSFDWRWRIHLKRMVLEENIFSYLEKYL